MRTRANSKNCLLDTAYREESYLQDQQDFNNDKSSNSSYDPYHHHHRNSRHDKLVDKTHINEVFDTSTVIAGDGNNSPHKSAIPRRDSSCSD